MGKSKNNGTNFLVQGSILAVASIISRIIGDTSGKCRYTYKLSKMYKADDRLVTKESDEKVESTEYEKKA